MAQTAAWPAPHDADRWAVLANRAMQDETLHVDQAENDAWLVTMHALIAEKLDYLAFTERRLAALKDRIRGRKLAQTNLRYKYGLKGRPLRLVRNDVKLYLGTSKPAGH